MARDSFGLHKIVRFVVLSFAIVGAINCVSSFKAFALLNSSTSLRVVGNQVLTSSNEVFVPYGISVYGGLEQRNYSSTMSNNDAQIEAAAKYWHANTIRLQVAESNLFAGKKAGKYNLKFMNMLNSEVSLSHKLGMAVVINDQTEFTSNNPAPTNETSNFWKIMASKYKSDGYVIFDLFNEPRLQVNNNNNISNNEPAPDVLFSLFGFSKNGTKPRVMHSHKNSTSIAWSIWRNGGKIGRTHYVGMQTLVSQIRSFGADNLIWIEGTNEARSLPPTKYLLDGDNVVYSIHHPNLNKPSSWQQIGNLAMSRPVVEGEWAQYESDWPECYSEAYRNAPLYLNYLQTNHIGIIAWSLQAGSLLKDSHSLKPTNIDKSYDPVHASDLKTPSMLLPNYKCQYGSGEGVGQLIQNHFASNSTKYYFN